MTNLVEVEIRNPVDITGAELVVILIRQDGKVLWINDTRGCIVRICRIKGKISIQDKRKKIGKKS
jgi:hypothetical protein